MRKWALVLGLVAIIGSLGTAQSVDIPRNATVLEAKLQLTGLALPVTTITVHRITVPWTESGVTWTSFFGSDPNNPIAAYDPVVVASSTVVPGINTIQSAGLKALVQGWVSGLFRNYGILLRKDSVVGDGRFYSSEVAASAPSLTVKYHTGNPLDPTTVVIRRGVAGEVIDSHVRRFSPTTNYGARSPIWVKVVGVLPNTKTNKVAMIWFKFGAGGCTRTLGYWKNHSKEGPAKYDPTWRRVGPRQEDTPFFRSGKTYYEALWAKPKGNAYWILAHQYIAAELNGLSGASLSAVASEFRQAGILLQTYRPSYDFKKNRRVRALFIMLADTLDRYNNGLIGPRHCDCKR